MPRWLRVFLLGTPSSDGLSDYASHNFGGAGRVVVESVEGPRFNPSDFETVSDPSELEDQLIELLNS